MTQTIRLQRLPVPRGHSAGTMSNRMSSSTRISVMSRPDEVRWTGVLAALAAWTIVVPFLGRAIGLVVDVATRVEIVDHVVPGAIATLAALYLNRVARRGPLAAERFALLASGVCVPGRLLGARRRICPLLVDAADAEQSWSAAIWHSITAVPIVGLAFLCVLRSTETRDPRSRHAPAGRRPSLALAGSPRLVASFALGGRRRSSRRDRAVPVNAGCARPGGHQRQQLADARPAPGRPVEPRGRQPRRHAGLLLRRARLPRPRRELVARRGFRSRRRGAQVLRARRRVRGRRHDVRVVRDAARARQQPHAPVVSRSADGGRTLAAPTRVAGPLAFQVRLTADPQAPAAAVPHVAAGLHGRPVPVRRERQPDRGVALGRRRTQLGAGRCPRATRSAARAGAGAGRRAATGRSTCCISTSARIASTTPPATRASAARRTPGASPSCSRARPTPAPRGASRWSTIASCRRGGSSPSCRPLPRWPSTHATAGSSRRSRTAATVPSDVHLWSLARGRRRLGGPDARQRHAGARPHVAVPAEDRGRARRTPRRRVLRPPRRCRRPPQRRLRAVVLRRRPQLHAPCRAHRPAVRLAHRRGQRARAAGPRQPDRARVRRRDGMLAAWTDTRAGTVASNKQDIAFAEAVVTRPDPLGDGRRGAALRRDRAAARRASALVVARRGRSPRPASA